VRKNGRRFFLSRSFSDKTNPRSFPKTGSGRYKTATRRNDQKERWFRSAGERISYEHLITSLPAGTMVDLLLQRKGKEVHASVTTSPAQFLIPRTVSHPGHPSPAQTSPDQTRPAQTRPGQTRPDHTIPGQARPGQASHTRPARAMPSHLTSQPASHTSSARANQACLQSHFADTSYFTGGWPLWQDGHDCNPSYLICGGLVFVPLTLPWCLIICAPTKDTPARFRPPSLRNAGRSILPR
jgi:hypothetical protein